MQNKNNDASWDAALRAKSRRRQLAEDELRAKAASLGVPKFLLRLFGSRKVRLASTVAAPTRRHD
jgi:hypothetical protein